MIKDVWPILAWRCPTSYTSWCQNTFEFISYGALRLLRKCWRKLELDQVGTAKSWQTESRIGSWGAVLDPCEIATAATGFGRSKRSIRFCDRSCHLATEGGDRSAFVVTCSKSPATATTQERAKWSASVPRSVGIDQMISIRLEWYH